MHSVGKQNSSMGFVLLVNFFCLGFCFFFGGGGLKFVAVTYVVCCQERVRYLYLDTVFCNTYHHYRAVLTLWNYKKKLAWISVLYVPRHKPAVYALCIVWYWILLNNTLPKMNHSLPLPIEVLFLQFACFWYSEWNTSIPCKVFLTILIYIFNAPSCTKQVHVFGDM